MIRAGLTLARRHRNHCKSNSKVLRAYTPKVKSIPPLCLCVWMRGGGGIKIFFCFVLKGGDSDAIKHEDRIF